MESEIFVVLVNGILLGYKSHLINTSRLMQVLENNLFFEKGKYYTFLKYHGIENIKSVSCSLLELL